MSEAEELLKRVTVASPCPASWRRMTGDERVRFCAECGLNVYNLSEMSAEAAADFVRRREGRLCIRYFRRADGSMLTKDCPIGLARVRQRIAAIAGILFGALLASLGPRLRVWSPVAGLLQWLRAHAPEITVPAVEEEEDRPQLRISWKSSGAGVVGEFPQVVVGERCESRPIDPSDEDGPEAILAPRPPEEPHPEQGEFEGFHPRLLPDLVNLARIERSVPRDHLTFIQRRAVEEKAGWYGGGRTGPPPAADRRRIPR